MDSGRLLAAATRLSGAVAEIKAIQERAIKAERAWNESRNRLADAYAERDAAKAELLEAALPEGDAR